MATTKQDESTRLDALLEGFSTSVKAVVSRFEPGPATVWQLADALLREHEQNYGAAVLPSLTQRTGEPREIEVWLELVQGLLNREAVARSSSQVIDGRLTLLGLARLDAGLDRVLRDAKVRWQLEDGLGYPLADVFWPWALPSRPLEWLELWNLRQAERVYDCAFSPDGRLLATADGDGTARLWDVAAGTERVTLSGHTGPVHACAFSPDGRLLATADGDGTARLWDVAAGTERATLNGHTGHVTHCAFSPNGRLLATAGNDRTARLWDVAAGTERVTLSGHTGPVTHCAFSPDGRLLATASGDGTARLWDVAAGTELARLSGHTDPILRCPFSPDGRLLATASAGLATANAVGDGTARLWDVATGVERATLSGHTSGVTDYVFSPDGRLFATAGGDGTARLWDVATGRERSRLSGRTGPVPPAVFGCAFSPDGRLLATTDSDGTARVWDVAAGTQRATLSGHTGVTECVFSPDGRLLATSGQDGTARLWEEVEAAGDLPAVAADVADGTDLIGVGRDAAAIANLIAARETVPPLSIGLFGDWGSGKSFLIGQIQERVRRLALRSQRAERSAYCGFIRNISFNAWHYADANLWASLVTHIFDELAKPEPAAGVVDDRASRAQLARLEEELAARSGVAERLERAREHARVLEARRRLLRWTWGLAGVSGDRSLGDLKGT